MKSVRCLRHNYRQLNAVVRHVFLPITNRSCSREAPFITMAMPADKDTTSLPLLHNALSSHNVTMAMSADKDTTNLPLLHNALSSHNVSFSEVLGKIKPYWFITYLDYPNESTPQSKNKIKLPTQNTECPATPILPKIDIIGDDFVTNTIIGYQPTVSHSVNCSNILKKRKKKMNKHKYKKRRKRDKFKRRNLENIKERKRRVKEKAEQRAKQAI